MGSHAKPRFTTSKRRLYATDELVSKVGGVQGASLTMLQCSVKPEAHILVATKLGDRIAEQKDLIVRFVGLLLPICWNSVRHVVVVQKDLQMNKGV